MLIGPDGECLCEERGDEFTLERGSPEDARLCDPCAQLIACATLDNRDDWQDKALAAGWVPAPSANDLRVMHEEDEASWDKTTWQGSADWLNARLRARSEKAKGQ